MNSHVYVYGTYDYCVVLGCYLDDTIITRTVAVAAAVAAASNFNLYTCNLWSN